MCVRSWSWVLLLLFGACAFDVPEDVEWDANPFDAEPGAPDAMPDVDASPVDAMPDDPAVLSTTQAPHDFGDVTTGGTSALLTIAVRNTGGSTSGTVGVQLAGANPSEFQIVAVTDGTDCASQSLDPDELCLVQVRFRPLAAAPATATVELTATPGGMVSVDLDGNGLSPGALELTSGAALDFTTVEIQAMSAFQTVVVHNTGTAATPALDVTLTDSTNYSIGTDTCDGVPLAGDASCSVQVRFAPTAVGSLPTSVSIKDTPSSGVAASASGTGTARIGVTKALGGAVTSNPAGLSCGAACTTSTVAFSQAPVTLTASDTADYLFDAWTGACAGANPSTMCSVPLTSPLTSVGATFRHVFTLGVSTTGPGLVTATGVSCGNASTDCSETYDAGTMVTLTATPDANHEVLAWTGAPCTAGMRMCTVTMDQARAVAVEFKRQYTITVSAAGSGAGTVTGGSINCPGTCSTTLFTGATVNLTETPATGTTGSRHVFGGWSGATGCTTGTSCLVTADADKTVTATFTLQHQLGVTIGGTGTGGVTGTGAFACGSGTCTQYYDAGSPVTLTATPGAVSTFTSYSGDCSGASCAPTMSAPRTVTATFTICPASQLGFTISNVAPCDVPAYGAALTLSGNVTIDTTAGTVMSGGTPVAGVVAALVTQNSGAYGAMVISHSSVTISSGAIVTVTGSRPLIVVAQGNFSVSGYVFANATGATAGPGAQLACTTGGGAAGALQSTGTATGGGGGGGGGYGSVGGAGGTIFPANGNTPTAGGAAWGATTIVPLVGGCRGGAAGLSGALGGAGGGAVQLVAGGTFFLASGAVVSTSGGGGQSLVINNSGGGGGGSGGSILIQASTIDLDGAVTANGGGGGAGRRTSPAAAGAGNDGDLAGGGTASGGTTTENGSGGNGAAATTAATPGSASTSGGNASPSGGGGGGGGVGRIHLQAGTVDLTGALVSPPAG